MTDEKRKLEAAQKAVKYLLSQSANETLRGDKPHMTLQEGYTPDDVSRIHDSNVDQLEAAHQKISTLQMEIALHKGSIKVLHLSIDTYQERLRQYEEASKALHRFVAGVQLQKHSRWCQEKHPDEIGECVVCEATALYTEYFNLLKD